MIDEVSALDEFYGPYKYKFSQQPKEYFTSQQVQSILDVVRENLIVDDNEHYLKVDIDKLTSVIQSLEPIRSHLYTEPERYTGVCAIQENCNDYSDFIESIMDDLKEDDDPVCPIKCAKRVNPQQEVLSEIIGAATLAENTRVLNVLSHEIDQAPEDEHDENYWKAISYVQEIIESLRRSTAGYKQHDD